MEDNSRIPEVGGDDTPQIFPTAHKKDVRQEEALDSSSTVCITATTAHSFDTSYINLLLVFC